MKILNVKELTPDKLLEELVKSNSNFSFISIGGSSDTINIPITISNKSESETEEECSISKCRTCIHSGLCDLEDDLNYDDYGY